MAFFWRQFKLMSRTRRAGYAMAVLSCVVGCTSMGACGIGGLVDPLNNIANQIEAAIAAIDINSAQWQDIVRDLKDQIPAVENDLKADIDEVLQRGIKATTVSAIAAGTLSHGACRRRSIVSRANSPVSRFRYIRRPFSASRRITWKFGASWTTK
ncbi:MAG: hypothetical protein IPK83_12620 [Planctomycetes bacterium]|nr:hypothetical protein [Planctomycetota bacterium]